MDYWATASPCKNPSLTTQGVAAVVSVASMFLLGGVTSQNGFEMKAVVLLDWLPT